ncbi:MAG: hypothetical protein M1355_01225 [Patescibacteria group bacterium]|nr:hypothetical protein [Patescibacteria group bacterium]
MSELLQRIIYGSLGIIFGVVLVWKSHEIVNNVGHNYWAEEHLGEGGTYNLVRFLGVFLMFVFFAYMIGKLGVVYLAVSKFFRNLIGS